MERIPNSRYFVDEEGSVYGPKRNKLCLTKSKKGYLRVKIDKRGKVFTKPVHRLVAETFIPNPENKPFVNHIDGDKTNNSVENLEWVTALENSKHAVDVLGIGRGATHSQVKHSEDLVHDICRRLEDKQRNVDIAKALEVPREMITRIRMGKSWRHISSSYNINPSRQSNISDETVKWVCHRLEEGLSTKEIISKCTTHSLTKSVVSKIRNKKLRTKITSKFNF